MLNPWQVEIVSNMPSRKKLKLSQHPTFPIDGQLSMPTLSNNSQPPNVPILYLLETSPAGMQGARHGHFSHSKSFPFNNDATISNTVPNNPSLQEANTCEDVSCSTSISTQPSEKLDHAKPKQIVLFGQTIQIDSGNENGEKKITSSCFDPLQDLLKRSSGERLECNPENQCKKD